MNVYWKMHTKTLLLQHVTDIDLVKPTKATGVTRTGVSIEMEVLYSY